MGVNWAKKLEEIAVNRSNPPEGEDWYTAEELKKKFQVGHSKIYQMINDERSRGTLEVHRGSRWSKENNCLVRGVWYRFVDPK